MQIQQAEARTPRWANSLLLNDHFKFWMQAKRTVAFFDSNSLLTITAEWQFLPVLMVDEHRYRQMKYQFIPWPVIWETKCMA